MKTIEVVAAIIEFDDKFLCVQRDIGKYDYISYKFEFPGGKVEELETHEQALIREIQEELGIEISIKNFFLTVRHQYPDFNILMHSFLCSTNSDTINLSVHVDFKWLTISEIENLDWAEADKPIVHKLLSSR